MSKGPDIDKIFNSDRYLKEQYTDADIGTKMTDGPMKEYIFPLENNQPVSVIFKDPPKGSSVATAIFKRGARFFGWKQKFVLKVQLNYDLYFDQYSAFESLFSKFIEYDLRYADTLGEDNQTKYLYIERFNNQYLDTLPEMMYYNHFVFTKNVNRWARFKRLFTAISLNVDPVLIDTLKFKLAEYLIKQRTELIMNDTEGMGHLRSQVNPAVIHQVMDLLIFMPYAYLFMVFKAMDVNEQFMLATDDHINPALIEDKTQQ